MRPPTGRIAVTSGLVASGWVAWAATGLSGSVLRAVVLTLFLLLVPGAAAVRLRGAAPGRDSHAVRAVEVAVLVVSLSLALDALVAVGFFLEHDLDSTRAVGALAALTTVLALSAHVGSGSGKRRAEPGPSGRQDSGGPPTGRPILARIRR